jgi:hypothetical protein
MRLIVFILFVIFIAVPFCFSQNDFGIEVQGFYTSSNISIPREYNTITSEGGGGYDIGIGIFKGVSSRTILRGGIHMWSAVFNPVHTGEYSVNNVEITGKLEEKGTLSYTGIYLFTDYEVDFFFIGGGFDLSLSHSYNSVISAYDSHDYLISRSVDNDKSFLTETFNTQFDIVVRGGIKFALNNMIQLRPSVEYDIPLKGIFDVEIPDYRLTPSQRKISFNAYLLKLGLSVEFHYH